MPFLSRLEPDALIRHFMAHPPEGFDALSTDEGIPGFRALFDPLTTADPAWVRRIDAVPLQRIWRHRLKLDTRFVGTTVSEHAWLRRDIAPGTLAERLRTRLAREAPLLVLKDVARPSPLFVEGDNAWLDAFAKGCAEAGFVMLEGQALAWVPIDFASIDAYLSRLTRGRRRDLRRKLRSRADLDVEMLRTGPAFEDAGRVDAFYALYMNVYRQSDIKFDLLTRAFFASVLRDADAGGLVFVYRYAGRMIGWNLCFEHDGLLVDKYIGLQYPDAREHDLYAVSWVENLDYARRRGLRAYVAGWTDPQVKAHLGARFSFTTHAVYPRNALLRAVLRRIAGSFEADRKWHADAIAPREDEDAADRP